MTPRRFAAPLALALTACATPAKAPEALVGARDDGCAAAPAPAPATARPSNCTDDGWCWVYPAPQGNDLHDAVAVGDEIFAVGDGGAILHFDGTAFEARTAPSATELRGVWASARDDVWAVGSSGALHYDGIDWTAEDGELSLQSVFGAGRDAVFATSFNALLRFDGTSWSWVEHPFSVELVAGWAASANDAVVTARNGAIFHYDGQTLRAAYNAPSELIAVAGKSSTDVYAVGPGGVVHFDGKDWQPIDAPSKWWTSVWFEGANVLVADREGEVMRLDGASFVPVANAVDGGAQRRSRVVATASGARFAVGQGGAVDRLTGDAWRTQSGAPRSFRGVWGSSERDVFAVGDHGAVAHFDGRAWSLLDAPTDAELTGVWGSGPGDVWITSRSDTLLHWNGAAFTKVDIPDLQDAWCVWGTARDDVFVGTSRGVVHFDGTTWNIQTTEGRIYRGISFAKNRAVAVDGNDRLMEFDGVAWQVKQAKLGSGLRSIWGRSATDLFVVDDRGAVLHTTDAGAAWTEVRKGDGHHLYDLRATPGGRLVAVGYEGVSLVSPDGATWFEQRTGTQEDLRQIWVGKDVVYAVGARGILRFE